MTKILVVEDNFDHRKLLVEIFRKYNVDADVAINGEEALTAINHLFNTQGCSYDLVCMDIHMPTMDGITALKHLRNNEAALGITGTSETKVIIISAINDIKTVIDSYNKVGVASYICKPISPMKLITEVRKCGIDLKTK